MFQFVHLNSGGKNLPLERGKLFVFSEMCEIDSSLGLRGKMAFFKTPKCQTNLLLPLPMLN